MTQELREAIDALDRISNYCEEIDHHIPEEERTGYKMNPDVLKILTFLQLRENFKYCPRCGQRIDWDHDDVYDNERSENGK